MEKDDVAVIIFLIILTIGIIFEAGILVFAYVNADKVECNFLWCTFTSGEMYSTSECYINGDEVNCSEFKW